jgi:hypothetical protein
MDVKMVFQVKGRTEPWSVWEKRAEENIWQIGGMKWQGAGENCTVTSFINFTPRVILLGMRLEEHIAWMEEKKMACRTFGFRKIFGICCMYEQPLASREGLSSVEWVSWFVIGYNMCPSTVSLGRMPADLTEDSCGFSPKKMLTSNDAINVCFHILPNLFTNRPIIRSYRLYSELVTSYIY